MQAAVEWLIFIALLTCGLVLRPLWRSVAGTTLRTAVGWGLVVWASWCVTWSCTLLMPHLPPGILDQLWYWTVAISVIPAMAVLGARRPGYGAWNFFVLVPLLLVLGWPALTVWTWQGPERLQIETPALIGFCLTILMGHGNYLSTRLALPALLSGVSVLLSLSQFSTTFGISWLSTASVRSWGATGMVATLIGGWIGTRSRPFTDLGAGRVWSDFREVFGIVWAKRCLDRINQEFADRERWPAQLGPFGLEWTRSEVSSAERVHLEARLEYALRWMLRRFVDPPWIQSRLPAPGNPPHPDSGLE